MSIVGHSNTRVEIPLQPQNRSLHALFRHFKSTFLCPCMRIEVVAKLYPVHSFTSGIQAKDMVIGLTDVFYGTDLRLTDSSYTVL